MTAETTTSGVSEAALSESLLHCVDTSAERSRIALDLAAKLSASLVDARGFSIASLLVEILGRAERHPRELLDPVVNHELLQSLQSFVLTALRQTPSTDLSDLQSIAKLCSQDQRLSSVLLNVCLQKLRHEIIQFRDIADSFAVPSTSTLDAFVTGDVVDEDDKLSSSFSLLQCLTFLKVFAWVVDSTTSVPMAVDYALLVLIGLRNTNLALTCLDALLALISTRGKHIAVLASAPPRAFSDVAWHRIRQLICDFTDIFTSNRGFTLWTTLITAGYESFPNNLVLENEEYWEALRNGLAYGSAQHRKSCLFILKKSLAVVNSEFETFSMAIKIPALKEIRLQYARYATLFETIVLARYLNQVQDCLHDLTTVAKPTSLVKSTWIVALVHAALAHGMQDSIRNVIGNWAMENTIPVLQHATPTAPNFLESCFLPWASLGFHFTSSIQYANSQTPVSSHGERLCKYLQRSLTFEMEYRVRNNTIKAVLNFLIVNTGHVYQFARAFILESLVQALKTVRQELDADVVDLVLQVSTVFGFIELVRDLMTLQCGQLIRHASAEAKMKVTIKPLLKACSVLQQEPESNESYAQAIQHFHSVLVTSGTHTEETPQIMSNDYLDNVFIDILYARIKQSHIQYLGGPGLKAACICLVRALDCSAEVDIEVEKLQHVLYSIWDETEVQEYPKQIVMKLPRIFLHTKCVKLCATNPLLRSTLSNVALELQRLAEHRIYAFPPLAAALRKLCLNVPETVQLPLAELFARLANNPTTTKLEFLLEDAISSRLVAYAPSRTYSAYYGKKEAYGHACVYDSLNRMPQSGAWIDIRRQIVDAILDLWINQREPPPMFSRWKSSAQLQTLLILFEGLIPCLADDDVEKYLSMSQRILSVEPMPRLRHLWEWIIARICMLKASRRDSILQKLGLLDLSNPKHVVSMQKIALILARLPDSDESFALELMTQLIPLAASPKIAVRHEAQWTVPDLWEHCVKQDFRSILANPAFARLNSHIRSLEVYKNPPPGRSLENLDLRVDHTLVNVFQGSYLMIEPIETQKVTNDDFLAVYMDDDDETKTCIQSKIQKKGLIPLGDATKAFQGNTKHIVDVIWSGKEVMMPGQIPTPLQTKASTWEDGIAGPVAAHIPGEGRLSRDLIVICSLIDNAYNLGGLSRVGEIFGVKSLQLADLRVIKNKDFTSVSVSSHLWLPIEQLEVDGISEYLIGRKLEGYTVIGIEQTDSSKVLGQKDCQFPRKTVLVLGSEREGISARLLAEMDFCVEIKQVGITRSMNVQTAAATVLYEYSRQHP